MQKDSMLSFFSGIFTSGLVAGRKRSNIMKELVYEVENDSGEIIGVARIKTTNNEVSICFHPMDVNGIEHKPLGYVLGYNYLLYGTRR